MLPSLDELSDHCIEDSGDRLSVSSCLAVMLHGSLRQCEHGV